MTGAVRQEGRQLQGPKRRGGTRTAPMCAESGQCSADSAWRLRVKTRRTDCGSEFQIKTGVVGQEWSYSIADNGTEVRSGKGDPTTTTATSRPVPRPWRAAPTRPPPPPPTARPARPATPPPPPPAPDHKTSVPDTSAVAPHAMRPRFVFRARFAVPGRAQRGDGGWGSGLGSTVTSPALGSLPGWFVVLEGRRQAGKSTDRTAGAAPARSGAARWS